MKCTRYKITDTVQYAQPGDHIVPNYDNAKNSFIFPNEPLTITLEDYISLRYKVEFRGYTYIKGTLCKVYVRGDVVLEAIQNTGIRPGGRLPGEYIWIQVSGSPRLTRVGSKEHKEAILNVEVNSLPKLKAKELVPGSVYMNGLNERSLYLGRYTVLGLSLVSGVWLDYIPNYFLRYRFSMDEDIIQVREQLVDKSPQYIKYIQQVLGLPTCRKCIANNLFTKEEINDVVTNFLHLPDQERLAFAPYKDRRNLQLSSDTMKLLQQLKEPVMRFLSLEELPKYLTHESGSVREAAKKQFDILQKEVGRCSQQTI